MAAFNKTNTTRIRVPALLGKSAVAPVTPRTGPAYLSVREVACRTSVTPRTVKRWIAGGHLPTTRLPSPKGLGQLRIRLSDVEVLMMRGTQP